MDYTAILNYTSYLMFIMACLVFGVNIIVEVIKKLIPGVPTSILATAVSVVLTLLVFFGWVSYKGITIYWYAVVAAVILGIFVAYAAMFGFDKFKDAFQKLKNYKT